MQNLAQVVWRTTWIWAMTMQMVQSADISLVIDDVGYQRKWDEQVVDFPPAVALAILPFSHHALEMSRRANQSGHEVLMHLPMESLTSEHRVSMVHMDMTKTQLDRFLHSAFKQVPHAIGLNNHQGSLVTQHPVIMTWVMEFLSQRPGTIFLDSRTTHKSVAFDMAEEQSIPALWRDVFLDDQPDAEQIKLQIDRLMTIARKEGYAIGIAHPRPSTIPVLKSWLMSLPEDIQLITLQEMLQKRKNPKWPRYSYPLRTAAKNWKLSPSSTSLDEQK